jgi:ADP-heptose:LPS heptosyltransferase
VEPIPRRALRIVDAFARRRRYDVAFCWSDDDALIGYCRRVARKTVTFSGDRAAGADVVAVKRPAQPMHAVDERLLLPQALGIAPAGKRLAYVVRPDERASARRWLESRVAPSTKVVGLQLASFPGKSYRDWPTRHFAALIDALAGHDPSLAFVAIGDAASRARAAELADAAPGRVHDATGVFALRETAALISGLRLYVGVDTGPTHLAGALGIPMVALYHCFHRGRLLAPLEHAALAVIEHPSSDADCTRATSMGDLGVEPVLAACIDLLSRPDPRAGGTH